MAPTPEARREAQRSLRDASFELARLRRVRGASHLTRRRIARARRRLAAAAVLLGSLAAADPAAALDPVFRHGFLLDGGLIDGSFLLSVSDLVDIDGDGDFDLFWVHRSDVYLVLNTGTATRPAFAATSQTNPFGLVGPAGSYAFPKFADLDGDGDLDAVDGDSFQENTGSASAPAFAAPVENAFGLLGGVTDLVDLDGDGDLDALTRFGQTRFLENTGTATAPAFVARPGSFGLDSGTITFVDIDGDGDLDGFGSDYFGAIVQRNTGSASAPAFAAPETNTFGLSRSNVFFRYVTFGFADLDGDGDLDAVVGGYKAGAEVMVPSENTGSATAPAFTHVANPFGLGNTFLSDTWAAFGDVDGDGDLDALVSGFSRNTGSASLPAFAPGPPLGVSGIETAFVDLDADGDLDAVSATFGVDPTVSWTENTGTVSLPAFASPVALLSGPGYFGAPSLGDLDADGDLDLLIGRSNGQLVFAWNTGSASIPAFGALATHPFGLASVGAQASPALADLDGDGDLDGLVGSLDGHLHFFRNTGSASTPAFAAAQLEPFGLVRAPQLDAYSYGAPVGPHPEVADIDGDGDLDVLVADGLGRVVFFENVVVDPEACTDGLDNDGDGRIDFGPGGDPGCASAADTSELGTKQCDNGEDDDGDGLVDFRPGGAGDPHCTGPLDDREAPDPPPPSGGCGLGPELLLLAPLLAAERRRRRRLRGGD